MTPIQEALVARIRTLIAAEAVQREVSMFGGRSFMVNNKMIVSALKNGGLLVRVDADQHCVLINRSGATQAHIGSDRDMGPGWIEVDPDFIDDQQLAFWIDRAMDYNRTTTAR